MANRVSKTPISLGLRALRANFIPGLLIQAAMIAIVLAYYWHPPTARWLGHLADLKLRFGFLFSVVISVAAGALLPELLHIVIHQRGRFSVINGRNLRFSIPFWIANGLTVDLLYRQQTVWFGSALNLHTVATKVAVDVFLYNPLWATPFCALAYEWRHRGYRRHDLGDLFTGHFYRARVVPLLLATWGVWIPVVAVIYSLPPLLQVPLFGLALCFWALLLGFLNPEPASV